MYRLPQKEEACTGTRSRHVEEIDCYVRDLATRVTFSLHYVAFSFSFDATVPSVHLQDFLLLLDSISFLSRTWSYFLYKKNIRFMEL